MTTTSPASFAELVARTRGLQPWRRVFHATSGVVLALGPGFLGWEPGAVAGVLAAATALLVAADLIRLRVPSINRLFFQFFARLASPREENAIASSTWYALGATIVWGVTPGPPAVAALLVLAFADPAASVVGRVWGRTRLGKGTLLGSGTFFVVAVAILWSAAGLPIAILAAATATAAEVAPLGLDDNLTVPLATAGVLWVMGIPLLG